MNVFDTNDSLTRYRRLMARRPELFVNPPGDIYEILTDDDRIARARRDAAVARRANGLPDEDTRVGVLADDPYLLLLRDAVRFADGTFGLYNRVMVPGGAAVLPLLDGRVVLIDRFRHGTRRWHLEAPRGSLSGTASPMDDARRELAEEIGAGIGDVVELGEFHATTGCLDEVHHLFLARITHVGGLDRHEAIRAVHTLTIAEVEELAANGTITDGPTLALILRARLRGLL